MNIEIILKKVFEDCRIYLSNYFNRAVIAGTVFALVYGIVLLYGLIRSRKILRSSILFSCFKLPVAVLFGFYGYLVLGITILSREAGTTYIIRWIPFTTWGTDLENLSLWIENILMMIPLGILLYILWKPCRRIGIQILVGGIFSLIIECIQLFMRLGKFETDDIMNNVFGTLIGFGICKGISALGYVLYTFILRKVHMIR